MQAPSTPLHAMKPPFLRLALAAAAAAALSTAARADDTLPHRKAGLWEVSMQVAGMPAPPGAMSSRHCIDEKTDEAAMRRGLSGSKDGECRQTSLRRSAGAVEVQADCTSAEGRTHVVARMSGDFQSSYKVDNHVTFDPPRHGMKEADMTLEAKYAGACPADMKPGDIRTAGGMTFNPSQRAAPGMPQGMDMNQLRSMSPEQLKALAEQMKAMHPPKAP